MTRRYGDLRLLESPLEAARRALLPADPTDPQASDLVPRIDAFEQKVYCDAWWWGYICGAVSAGLVGAAFVIGWLEWAA